MFDWLIEKRMKGQSTKDLIDTYWLIFLIIGSGIAIMFVLVGFNNSNTQYRSSECYISLQINCRFTNIIRSDNNNFILIVNITNNLGEEIFIKSNGIQIKLTNKKIFFGSCTPILIKNNQNSSCKISIPANSINTNKEIKDSVKIVYSVCSSFKCIGNYIAIGNAYQYYS